MLNFAIEVGDIGESVESIATDPWVNGFVVSTHYGRVIFFNTDNGDVETRWKWRTDGGKIARGVCFTEAANTVTIFTMDDGTMYVP